MNKKILWSDSLMWLTAWQYIPMARSLLTISITALSGPHQIIYRCCHILLEYGIKQTNDKQRFEKRNIIGWHDYGVLFHFLKVLQDLFWNDIVQKQKKLEQLVNTYTTHKVTCTLGTGRSLTEGSCIISSLLFSTSCTHTRTFPEAIVRKFINQWNKGLLPLFCLPNFSEIV